MGDIIKSEVEQNNLEKIRLQKQGDDYKNQILNDIKSITPKELDQMTKDTVNNNEKPKTFLERLQQMIKSFFKKF